MNPWLYINAYQPLHSFCFHTPFITKHIFIRKHNLRVLLPYWQPGKPSKWYSKPYSTPLKINISHQKISNNHNNWKGKILWTKHLHFPLGGTASLFPGCIFSLPPAPVFVWGSPTHHEAAIPLLQRSRRLAQWRTPGVWWRTPSLNQWHECYEKLHFISFFYLGTLYLINLICCPLNFVCMFLVKKPSQRMIHKLQGQRMLCPKFWVKGSMPTGFPIETPFNLQAAIFCAFDAKWDLASVSPVSYEMFHTQ